jgi:hypothetical protein
MVRNQSEGELNFEPGVCQEMLTDPFGFFLINLITALPTGKLSVSGIRLAQMKRQMTEIECILPVFLGEMEAK